MEEKFLKYLCCPKTHLPLTLTDEQKNEFGCIETGTLLSEDGVNCYPIINGIPRFVDEEFYSKSFGYEWNRWPRIQFESENIGKPMEGHTTRMFKKITEFTESQVQGKLCVEFGCGPGRFLDVIKNMGGIAVGLDLSLAVEAARNNFLNEPNVLIVQGDILNPPFRKDSFDLGYSIGVLHHTPDPFLGFSNLSNVVKPDGTVACSVYGKKGLYNYPSVHLYRNLHKINGLILGRNTAIKIAQQYSEFSAKKLYFIHNQLRMKGRFFPIIVGLIELLFVVVLNIPDEKWRILDTFDAITPHYASTHTSEEVGNWFVRNGLQQIKQTGWGSTSFVGIKKP